MDAVQSQWLAGVMFIMLTYFSMASCQSTDCLHENFTFESIDSNDTNDTILFNSTFARRIRVGNNNGHVYKQAGPTIDHTTMSARGHFLVFEYLSCRLRLSPGYTFTTASTPPFRCPSSLASCSMTFYYSMNGNYVGNLSVRTDDQELLYLAGDQGTGNGWLGATVNASFSKNETIQFFFDVFCNPNPPVIDLRTFTNLADGDTGLDDISVRCTCSEESCDIPSTSQPATATTVSVTRVSTVQELSASPVPTTGTPVRTLNTSTPSPTGGGTTVTSTPSSSSPSEDNTLVLALAIAVPVALLSIVLILLVMCLRCKKGKARRLNTQSSTLPIARYSPDSPANQVSFDSPATPMSFDNRNYDGRDLMNGKKKEANSNQNGALNDHASNGVPAVPSVPPPSTLSHVGGKISPRSTSPEAEDEDYDEPETHPVRANVQYSLAGAPARFSPVRPDQVEGIKAGLAALPQYDHLMHEDIDPDVYDQPFQEPGSTPAAIYNQLSGQAYRHIPAVHVSSHEKIGSGSFGIVYRGSWKLPNGMIIDTAVKQLRANASEDMRLKLLQEAAIMGQFNHRNVVKLYGVVTDGPATTLMIVELMGEDLKSHLVDLRTKGPQAIKEARLLQFSTDIALGMEYLSSRGFVHRDLAARNVMLDARSTCKIGDFGMSRDLEENNYYTSAGGVIPVKWTAPEAIHFRQYSCASDVWSYGIVLYEIFTIGRKPYAGWPNEEVAQKVRRGYRLPAPDGCRPEIYKLMAECWEDDKHQRPPFSDILSSLNVIRSCLKLSQQEKSSNSEGTSGGTGGGTAATSSGNDGSASPRAASPSVDTFAMDNAIPEVEYDVVADAAAHLKRVNYTAAEMSKNRAWRAEAARRHPRGSRVTSPRSSEYDEIVLSPTHTRTLSMSSSYTETDI